MEKISIKRGATLSLAGLFTLPAGSWSARSNVEDSSGNVIFSFETTLVEDSSTPGSTHSLLMVASSSNTLLLEVGTTYISDIIFIDDSPEPVVLKTDTFGIKAIKEVT